ncbi:MAG: hypothetical protein J7577_12010 [Sphingobacteriaceae bacterium]|nr:hypothetical protein [Sphingobacteriaceae bacterium]
MKKHLFLFALLGTGCKKDELPEETETGKNTFGCVVNREIFREKSAPGSLQVQYSTNNGVSYFSVGTLGTLKNAENPAIALMVWGKPLEEGKTYSLASERKAGAVFASYFYGSASNVKDFNAASGLRGELYIKKINKDGILLS